MDLLTATVASQATAGVALGNEARVYISQQPVDPLAGITLANVDSVTPQQVLTVGANVAASAVPVNVTVTALTKRKFKGELIEIGTTETFLELNADAALNATTINVTKCPALTAGDSLRYFFWVTSELRAETLPNFAKSPNFITADYDTVQISAPGIPTDTDETLVCGDPLRTPFQYSLWRAAKAKEDGDNAGAVRAFISFSPRIGGGERERKVGYLNVASKAAGSANGQASNMSYGVRVIGKPAATEIVT